MKNAAPVIIIILSIPLAGLVFWLWPESDFVPPAGFSTLPQQPVDAVTPADDKLQSGDGVIVTAPARIGRSLGADSYEISNEPNSLAARFNIVYFAEYDFFQISLETEPLAESRQNAEDIFLSQLQVSEADACRLNVSVRTRLEVSQFYAGTELGLSFCPDSVEL